MATGLPRDHIAAVWRYPVKSMLGEELNAVAVTGHGLLGDRAYALVDRTDGRAATAKHPRKWPHLFEFRAGFVKPPRPGAPLPAVRIALPDGTHLSSAQPDLEDCLTRAVGRAVSFTPADFDHVPGTAGERGIGWEEYWPDLDVLEHRDEVMEWAAPAGTFFDAAPVHLLTTATLDRLRQLYPAGRFEARRFRPNFVVATAEAGFVENGWVGRTLQIGDEVRLAVDEPCTRCVMTTLAQSDLPADLGILRAAVTQNAGHVGVYARVLQGGAVRRGDAVVLL
jgi:uncharacterized protein